MLPPKAASGTKEDPNLVPSITNKRIVGCICKYLAFIVCPFVHDLLHRISVNCFRSVHVTDYMCIKNTGINCPKCSVSSLRMHESH